MHLTQSVKESIINHADKRYPQECCGFIVQKIDQLIVFPVENISRFPKTSFLISEEGYKAAEGEGNIVAYYHSHPDEGAAPSELDRMNAEQVELPSYIYSCKNKDFGWYQPTGYRIPLENRPFAYGISDCWILVCDYYKYTFNIDIPRGDIRTGNDDVINKNMLGDYINELMESAGFESVYGQSYQPHDILIMKVKSNHANHTGILLDESTFFHHLQHHPSAKSAFGSFWRNKVCNTYRIKDTQRLKVHD